MGTSSALALALVLTIGAARPALAQSDAASPTSETRRINPEECVSEPRPYDEIATTLELDGDGIPAPARTQISPPLGELADAATASAIGDAARHVIACFNAGDIPRGAALMTDNGLQRVFWGLTIDQENRDLAQVRIPGPPELGGDRRDDAAGWPGSGVRGDERAVATARGSGDDALRFRQRGWNVVA